MRQIKNQEKIKQKSFFIGFQIWEWQEKSKESKTSQNERPSHVCGSKLIYLWKATGT